MAEVGGYAITLSRVDRHLKKTLGNKPLGEIENKVARLAAANHLIDRHIVLNFIEKSTNVGDSQIVYEVSKLTDRLKEVGKNLQQHLSENKLSKEELRYEIRWRLAWAKYLEQKLDEEKLESYFRKFRRKFDGTEMQVAHILFSKNLDSNEQAESVREQITRGEISWNDAARKYSIASTSSENGGEIGWIDYHGPMVPEFCRQAMKLQKDEISTPIGTKFGVHLIRCLEIRSGRVTFSKAKNAVREDAVRYLFNNIAKKNRSKADVQIHLKDKLETMRSK